VLSSVAYQRADNILNVKARSSQACGISTADLANSNPLSSYVTFFDSSQMAAVDAFNSNGELKVNFLRNNNTTYSAPNWRSLGNFLRTAASFNIVDLTGTYIYTWVAGTNNEQTRAFNLRIQDVSGTLTGTAFFGFTSAMTGANDSLESDYTGIIDRMYCNWTGKGSDINVNYNFTTGLFTGINAGAERGYKVAAQRQIFTFSPTANIWTATDNKLRYAPTNSCDFTAAMLTAGFKYNESRPFSTNPASAPTSSPTAAFTNALFTPSTATNAGLKAEITTALGGSVPVN
jgi:hypothetical protein